MTGKQKMMSHVSAHKVTTKTTRKQIQNKRTTRACDRCRFKKSKCDGSQPCTNCQLNERTCVYSARRRRDARSWYCGMQDALDEALQRLYAACKQANAFPGRLPIEPEGKATTEDILNGLGLATEPGPIDNVEPYLIPVASQSGQLPVLFKDEPNTSDTMSIQSPVTNTQTLDGSAQTSQTLVDVPLNHNQDIGGSSHLSETHVTSPIALDMCGQFNDIIYPTRRSDVSFNQPAVPLVGATTLPESEHDIQPDLLGDQAETSLAASERNDRSNGSMEHAQASMLLSTFHPLNNETLWDQLWPSASAEVMELDSISSPFTRFPGIMLSTNSFQNEETPSAN